MGFARGAHIARGTIIVGAKAREKLPYREKFHKRFLQVMVNIPVGLISVISFPAIP